MTVLVKLKMRFGRSLRNEMSSSCQVDPQHLSDMRPRSFSGLATIVDRNSRGTGASGRMTRVLRGCRLGVRSNDHLRQ